MSEQEYLGEFPHELSPAPTPAEWAIIYISRYGGIDGDHHKQWVLDQVARILHGVPVIITMARWSDGTEEMRHRTGEATESYLRWVDEQRGELCGDGLHEYEYSEGIAP
jgi:hypothetical protein